MPLFSYNPSLRKVPFAWQVLPQDDNFYCANEAGAGVCLTGRPRRFLPRLNGVALAYCLRHSISRLIMMCAV